VIGYVVVSTKITHIWLKKEISSEYSVKHVYIKEKCATTSKFWKWCCLDPDNGYDDDYFC